MSNKLPEILAEIEKSRAHVARLESQATVLLDAQEAELKLARTALGLNGIVRANLAALAQPKARLAAGNVQVHDARKVRVKTKRTRGIVTDQTRTSVKQMVKAGETGATMAKALGLSLPTIQNIKKQLGLVRKK